MDYILDIPMDESPSSLIAFDYSPNLRHAKVINASFVPGHSGYSLHCTGQGRAISKNVPLDLSDDFTVLFWFRQFKSGDYATPDKIVFQFAFSDDPDDPIVQFLSDSIPLNTWTHVAMAREGNGAKCYINGVLVSTLTFPGIDPVEWAIQQYIPSDGFTYELTMIFGANGAPFATADIDEYKLVKGALTAQEINSLMNPQYHDFYIIDGVNFKDFDVYVEDSSGLVDALELKEPLKVNWTADHGEIVDLERPRHLTREIELDCWIKGANMLEWTMKQSNFLRQFQTKGLHRLECRIDNKRPLLFVVYMAEGTEIEKKWKNGEFFGRFKLKLKDPEPVRRILRFQNLNNQYLTPQQNLTAKIRFTCFSAVNVYWDDKGPVSKDVLAGNDLTVTYEYDGLKDFYEIMITGEPELMTNFSTNCITVWNRL